VRTEHWFLRTGSSRDRTLSEKRNAAAFRTDRAGAAQRHGRIVRSPRRRGPGPASRIDTPGPRVLT
jgi:hypothetical protein